MEIDRDRVLKQGLQFADVYQTLQAFLGGAYVNQFNRFGRQWKVYLQAEPEYRVSADKINSFYVRNSKGEMAPLASLVSVKRVSGPEYTNRFNLFRTIQINGSPAPRYSSGQAMAAILATEVLPAGMGYAWATCPSGESRVDKRCLACQFSAFSLSAALCELVSPFQRAVVSSIRFSEQMPDCYYKLDQCVCSNWTRVLIGPQPERNLDRGVAILENKNNKKGLVELLFASQPIPGDILCSFWDASLSGLQRRRRDGHRVLGSSSSPA
jgi:hypothetical protein